MKKRTVSKIVFLSATAFILVFIFIMSARPADESAGLSLFWDYRICKLFIPAFNSLSAEEQLQSASAIDHYVRKSAHFAEFAALGALLYADFHLFDIKRYRCLLFAFISGAAAAVSDEIHQIFVPGRSCEISDMLLDFTGVVTGCLFSLLIFYIITSAKRKKTQKTA